MPPTIAKPNRHARVEQARQTALPRKPIPVLLLLVRVYGHGWDDQLVFGPGVDPPAAVALLRSRLDDGEPGDFGSIVAEWLAETRARWIG